MVTRTTNYEKYVFKLDVVDTCGECGVAVKTIEQIIAGCGVL